MGILLLTTHPLLAQVSTRTIHLIKAGVLLDSLGSRVDSVSNLVLTGPINGADVATIHEMASLKVLDLAKTSIVNGGDPTGEYYTQADVVTEYMFMNCNKLTSISLPESTKEIRDYSFVFCESLTSMTIPANVKSISDNPFMFCTSLRKFVVDSLNTNYVAYKSCLFTKDTTQLISFPNQCTSQFVVPPMVKSFGQSAFYGCLNLSSVSISKSVTTIPSGCFTNCIRLIRLTVNKDNPYFSSVDGVLYSKDSTVLLLCPNGKSAQFTIPEGVEVLETESFYTCRNLTAIVIPKSVKTINNNAFFACMGLTRFVVDKDNPAYCAVGGVLFTKDAKNLISYPNAKSVRYTVPVGVTSIDDYAFFACTNLEIVTLPTSLKRIGSSAFHNCASLTSIVIPDSVVDINKAAFASCYYLTSLTIGKAVTQIGSDAFLYCESLNVIRSYMKTAPKIGNTVFSLVDKSKCELYVPFGSLDSYTSTLIWKEFTHIVEEPNAVKVSTLEKTVIYSTNGNLCIQTKEPIAVTVHTISGLCVFDQIVADDLQVALDKGIYLVKTPKERLTILVK